MNEACEIRFGQIMSPIMPTANAVIRPAERQDVPAIATMAGEFYAFATGIIGCDPTFDLEMAESRLAQHGFGAKPRFSAIIAEIEKMPIGYAIYNIGFWGDPFEGMVFVSDLFVRETWRSRGIGQQLMRHLAEIGHSEGCERVMWTVWMKNEAAKRFYSQLGGIPVEDQLLYTWPI